MTRTPLSETDEVQATPGQIQLLHALEKGPRSVGQLAGDLGISSPAVTQLVNHLEKSGLLCRSHDPTDRRVVLVDYAPGMRASAGHMIERLRRRLAWTVQGMTDAEVRGFVKGLSLLAESFEREI